MHGKTTVDMEKYAHSPQRFWQSVNWPAGVQSYWPVSVCAVAEAATATKVARVEKRILNGGCLLRDDGYRTQVTSLGGFS